MAFEWEDLLLYLDDRAVVPVIGRELLTMDVDGESILLDQYLGKELATQLKVSGPWDQRVPNLTEVAFRYLQSGGERSRIYNRINAILRDHPLPIPERLCKLAAISDFGLFVSTTFDTLLVRAVDEVRFGGQQKTQRLAYKPELPVQDLPSESILRDAVTVYQLFGQASSLPDYAVTEEDHLEFLHKLQSEDLQPKRLFHELRKKNLLLLGCGLPNWLVRFFVRTVKNQRLFGSSDTLKVIADQRVRDNAELVLFLKLYETEVSEIGGAAEFVDELHRLWQDRHRQREVEPAVVEETPRDADIFLSYASEDRELVERLKATLDQAGLKAWFDKQDIPDAADWHRRIGQNVRRCSIFIPCLSRHAEARREGYFRKEWDLAIERAKGFTGSSRRFIWPIALDDISNQSDEIPDEFGRSQWARLEGGNPTRDFLEELQREIRDLRSPSYH